jgi:hypothetical protein
MLLKQASHQAIFSGSLIVKVVQGNPQALQQLL